MAAADSQQASLKKENLKLVQQVRRLQDVINTMRDEISDANAEIAASRRLFDEQKAVLLQELHRERTWREQLQRKLLGADVIKISVATNTATDVSTSTVADAQTMTLSSENPMPLIAVPPSFAPQTAISPVVERFGRSSSSLGRFADWLSRRTCYEAHSLLFIFEEMGATSVEELCATITERDLIERGVPVAKARALMHLVKEHTAALLDGPYTRSMQF